MGKTTLDNFTHGDLLWPYFYPKITLSESTTIHRMLRARNLPEPWKCHTNTVGDVSDI